MVGAIVVAAAISGGLSGTARATYSIAATDRATRQMGGSVTSCVGNLDVGIVYGSSPGHGVVHAQAQLSPTGGPKMRAVMMLGMDAAPSMIISTITAPSFDAGFASRQYGVVDLMGRHAGFSGANAMAYKEDRQGTDGTFTYSVQGNILTSGKVLDQAVMGFKNGGCDLADKLMLALEAGAANGEGDSRCTTPRKIPSDSAFIQVDLENGAPGSYLKLSVRGTGTQNPLPMLRAMFDAWRKTHPCASGGGTDGGSAEVGGTTPDARDAAEADVVVDAPARAADAPPGGTDGKLDGSGGAAGGDGGGRADGAAGAGGSGGGGSAGRDAGMDGSGPSAAGNGCGSCTLQGPPGGRIVAIVLALGAAFLVARRRRRA